MVSDVAIIPLDPICQDCDQSDTELVVVAIGTDKHRCLCRDCAVARFGESTVERSYAATRPRRRQ